MACARAIHTGGGDTPQNPIFLEGPMIQQLINLVPILSFEHFYKEREKLWEQMWIADNEGRPWQALGFLEQIVQMHRLMWAYHHLHSSIANTLRRGFRCMRRETIELKALSGDAYAGFWEVHLDTSQLPEAQERKFILALLLSVQPSERKLELFHKVIRFLKATTLLELHQLADELQSLLPTEDSQVTQIRATWNL